MPNTRLAVLKRQGSSSIIEERNRKHAKTKTSRACAQSIMARLAPQRSRDRDLHSAPITKLQFSGSPIGRRLTLELIEIDQDTMSSSVAIHIVSPAEFDRGTAQTPGSERRAAIAPALGIASAIWGGLFEVAPGSRTGIHHHGEQETIAYVLSGTCEIRWGASGESVARAKAGDFIHVPAYLPHMEINPSKQEPFRWVVVRSTATPIVVNLPDDTWP